MQWRFAAIKPIAYLAGHLRTSALILFRDSRSCLSAPSVASTPVSLTFPSRPLEVESQLDDGFRVDAASTCSAAKSIGEAISVNGTASKDISFFRCPLNAKCGTNQLYAGRTPRIKRTVSHAPSPLTPVKRRFGFADRMLLRKMFLSTTRLQFVLIFFAYSQAGDL